MKDYSAPPCRRCGCWHDTGAVWCSYYGGVIEDNMSNDYSNRLNDQTLNPVGLTRMLERVRDLGAAPVVVQGRPPVPAPGSMAADPPPWTITVNPEVPSELVWRCNADALWLTQHGFTQDQFLQWSRWFEAEFLIAVQPLFGAPLTPRLVQYVAHELAQEVLAMGQRYGAVSSG